ncbi:MAG: MBL fold metallo-hydrolase RNA specificity domain-containing protein [Chloroflexota bacterium]
MKIHFHGAAQTVTGSLHLLEINGTKLLLECGLYQGHRKESFERNRNFPFNPSEIDAVILSHAHIDHSGNLPNLVLQGYEGPIYCTSATAHLTHLMLLDSGHIHEKQAETVSWRNAQKGLPAVDPLYTQQDAAQVKPLLREIPYDVPFEPAHGAVARFVDAGHILGSAAVALDVEEKGQKTSIWFSGDIGRRNLPLLRDPILPEKVDVLLMEATYGDKPHRSPDIAYEEMCRVINKTIKRGGKVIIPSFAIGRTQELVYNLNRMYESGDLPEVPVYVDSPLAVNASNIFKQFPDCYDDETLDWIERGHPALDFPLLQYIQNLDDSKALNPRQDPMIIISASGMAEVGRIVFHIRWNIENPRNTIMIVSWQAPGTLGRRLADREPAVKILGETFQVKAEIATIGGLSAHAGQDLLLEYARSGHAQKKGIFLVHGEEGPATILQDKLGERGLQRVFYPSARQKLEI